MNGKRFQDIDSGDARYKLYFRSTQFEIPLFHHVLEDLIHFGTLSVLYRNPHEHF